MKIESNPAHVEAATTPLHWKQGFAEDFADFPMAYRRVKATVLQEPRRLCWSDGAAACIGLNSKHLERHAHDFESCFAQGQVEYLGQTLAPVASAYAGHQFGVWAGQLGDGRAMLLGDLPSQASAGDWGFDAIDSIHLSDRIEVQLKGSGQTPYSRMGDGRAVLRSSIREFLGSEAMIGLGIPSTRALCLYGSDDPVFRETTETAAIVTRLAPTFLRFGHVEFFAHFHHHDALNHFLRKLAKRHYPKALSARHDASGLNDDDLYKLALFKSIASRTGDLIARWQSVGFCHGVMNTDNMSLIGLTIDYGPFGFLDQYDEDHVCNHSDHQGRYSYSNQAAVGAWNCKALALAFRAVISDEAAPFLAEGLQAYRRAYEMRWQERFATKFGLMPAGFKTQQKSDNPQNAQSDEQNLGNDGGASIHQFLEQSMQMLQRCKPDFTLFFRRLSKTSLNPPQEASELRDTVLDLASFDAWWDAYRDIAQGQMSRLRWDSSHRQAMMLAVNPKYILRNHLAELAIRRARGDHGQPDYDEIERLLHVLRKPYDEQPEFESYAAEPPQWAKGLSVSCSS